VRLYSSTSTRTVQYRRVPKVLVSYPGWHGSIAFCVTVLAGVLELLAHTAVPVYSSTQGAATGTVGPRGSVFEVFSTPYPGEGILDFSSASAGYSSSCGTVCSVKILFDRNPRHNERLPIPGLFLVALAVRYSISWLR